MSVKNSDYYPIIKLGLFKGVFVLIFFVLNSCDSEELIEPSAVDISEKTNEFRLSPLVFERNGIVLTEVIDYPKFEESEFELLSDNIKFQPGKNIIEFKLKSFVLDVPTVDERIYRNKNITGFQHILFMDPKNGKVDKLNESKVYTDLKLGDNYRFAVLNRSYDVSLKNTSAFLFFKIFVDEKVSELVQGIEDSLAYVVSPRGNFYDTDAKKLMFDMVLKNISLNKDGNYISLTIDDTEFKLTKNVPFYIEGLTLGRHIIKVLIKDKEDKTIQGILNPNNIYAIELKEYNPYE